MKHSQNGLNNKTILINGFFLCRRLNGIERYAYEITKRLDELSKPGEISIIVPKDSVNIPEYKNIQIIKHGKKKQNILWQMLTLQWFLIRRKQYMILEFGNTVLPLAPGIVFLHDIYCEFFSEDFIKLKDKIIRSYNRWQYRQIAKKAKRIITVTHHSKNEIAKTLNINPSKIDVVYSSADHMYSINSDNSILEEFPVLNNLPFYFCLGSLSKRKNIKWIINYAWKNPGDLFAISGSSLHTVKVDELEKSKPDNIILLGYLNDEKVKALMQKCKAFILPSYYEGFGLTPLEALTCGAKIIVSKAASLPEVYGDTAHYIDPYNINVNLDNLLKETVDKPDKVLTKYSYDKSAKQVYKLIKEILSGSK